MGVQHPFVVPLHYAFQTANQLVLVMEFCPRGCLQTLLKRNGPLQENVAKHYGASILLAIGHLHDVGIVHRDIKPENVVLDEEGQALLADFGICREEVYGEEDARTFCGTLAFSAPEVLDGRHYGRAVDLYSFGALLFTLLVGRQPFSARNEEEL